MQQTGLAQSASQQDVRRAFPALQVIVLAAGVAAALVAQFVLDEMADSSDTWHEIQHGLLLFAGLFIGWSLTSLYSVARKRDRR